MLGSCKVGNFVVSTPVLRGLRARFPDAVIGFIGSEVTADFERALPGLDWRCSWDDPSPGSGLRLQQTFTEQRQRHGPVQLALNLDGFNPLTCSLVPLVRAGLCGRWQPQRQSTPRFALGGAPASALSGGSRLGQPAFKQRYADVFSSNYIAELFCQLAWVQDHVDPTAIELPFVEPPFAVPDVLIHCTTARAAKVWPFSHWRQVLDVADANGWSVGLVGSPPAAQKEAYNAGDGEDSLLQSTGLVDLRGKTSLMQLAGACRQAKAVISVDAGPLHIAAAVGTPTYAIIGNDAMGWELVRCVYGCPVAAMSRAASVPFHAQPAPTTDSATTLVWLMATHAWQAIQPSAVIEWLMLQLN